MGERHRVVLRRSRPLPGERYAHLWRAVCVTCLRFSSVEYGPKADALAWGSAHELRHNQPLRHEGGEL